jgi:hypothetical protein
MEDTMPRRAKGPTAAFVGKVTKPGKYGDGANLYLRVRSKDAKCWAYIYAPHGKRPEMGSALLLALMPCRSARRV